MDTHESHTHGVNKASTQPTSVSVGSDSAYECEVPGASVGSLDAPHYHIFTVEMGEDLEVAKTLRRAGHDVKCVTGTRRRYDKRRPFVDGKQPIVENEFPVLSGYIFVRTSLRTYDEVRETPGVLRPLFLAGHRDTPCYEHVATVDEAALDVLLNKAARGELDQGLAIKQIEHAFNAQVGLAEATSAKQKKKARSARRLHKWKEKAGIVVGTTFNSFEELRAAL